MNTNVNEQLTGDCKNLPGAIERKYVVQGGIFRYRRYLGSIGLWWDSSEYGWVGRLSAGKVWFLREKLRLEVAPAGETPREAYKPPQSLPKEPVRLGSAPKRPKRVEGQETRWEEYSAMPVKTMRDARVRAGLNINLRRCYWGCELCQSCMECISNVQENDILPHPELGVWGDEEEQEREHSALPVQA